MNRPTTNDPEALNEFIDYQEAIIQENDTSILTMSICASGAESLFEDLKEYAKHNGSCIVWQDSTECDCGLQELLT